MRIEYQPVDEAHIEPAVQLVLSAYREEKQAVPCLPAAEYFSKKLRTLIANLFARGSGFAAVSDGELTGFLAGFETGELWGRNKGIYSPLYGHAAVSENRSSVYQGLYTRAAEMWVQKQHFTHALTLFAHDQEIIDTWFWLGFGMRCVDSIREVLPIQVGNPDPAVTIRKGGLADIPALRTIETQFANYWPQAPNFMSQEGINPVQSYTDWFTKPNRHFWVAYLEGEAVGQIRIQPQAETFISEHPDVMNVTGAFVTGAARKTGIGVMLLAAVQQWLLDNDYPLCGVDFESFNIPGSRFWNRHFIPYTYSLTRRIDERVV